MQIAIDKATSWGHKNGITFGAQKPFPIVFTMGRKGHSQFLTLKIDGNLLEYQTSVKYLCIILDQRLNFKNHLAKMHQGGGSANSCKAGHG